MHDLPPDFYFDPCPEEQTGWTDFYPGPAPDPWYQSPPYFDSWVEQPVYPDRFYQPTQPFYDRPPQIDPSPAPSWSPPAQTYQVWTPEYNFQDSTPSFQFETPSYTSNVSYTPSYSVPSMQDNQELVVILLLALFAVGLILMAYAIAKSFEDSSDNITGLSAMDISPEEMLDTLSASRPDLTEEEAHAYAAQVGSALYQAQNRKISGLTHGSR